MDYTNVNIELRTLTNDIKQRHKTRMERPSSIKPVGVSAKPSQPNNEPNDPKKFKLTQLLNNDNLN